MHEGNVNQRNKNNPTKTSNHNTTVIRKKLATQHATTCLNQAKGNTAKANSPREQPTTQPHKHTSKETGTQTYRKAEKQAHTNTRPVAYTKDALLNFAAKNLTEKQASKPTN